LKKSKILPNNKRGKSYLKIGKIPYANLFPIFYALQKRCDCSEYEFIEGVPSTVNRLLRSGEIDVSPSSSIEYLRYKNQYSLIENHSISSKGPAGSILLLSRKPIEKLKSETIKVSSQSETSVVLLKIILKKFHGTECSLEPSDESPDSLINKAGAFLVIGDEALKAKKTLSPVYIYDLGDLWYENTGLPFVFALWIARKDCLVQKGSLIKTFINDLEKSKVLALKSLDEIAEELRPLLIKRYSLNMTKEELVSYWTGISYELSEEHRKGLELFRKYAEESHSL